MPQSTNWSNPNFNGNTTTNNNTNDGNSHIKKKTTGNKFFINTKITKGNTDTWWSTILDNVTGASVKNRSFFINNYEKIKSNKPYLPTKQQFSLLTLEKKQDLYQKTRRDIMSSNQNQFGETESGGNGDNRPPVERVVGGQTILAAAPTEAEVSQSDATNAAETKLTARRVKKRGRKMNIYTQSKDKLTLGKKSLLGVV